MARFNLKSLVSIILFAGFFSAWAQDVVQVSTPKVETAQEKSAETPAEQDSESKTAVDEALDQYTSLESPSNPGSEGPNPDSDIEKGLKIPVALDLREMDIVDTIKFLATKGGLNMVATKSVSGRVTLFLNNVTIGDVLDIIILTNSLACEKKKNIITVMTDAEYQALYGKPYVDKREAKTITLTYADPANMVTMLSNVKSDIGKIVADTTTATVIMIDTPEKIKEMEEVIKRIDLPTITRVIPTVEEAFVLSYANVKDIEPEITKSLTENIGAIRIDERTNTLVVSDLEHKMEKIRKLVKAFDAKTKQVLIEAKIIELTLDDDYYRGIEWERLISSMDDLNLAGTFPFGSSGTSSMIITMGNMAQHKYDLTLSFLRSLGETKIISEPYISVCNKEEAKFMVGTREAYVTTTTTTGEVTTSVSEAVEFIDVGVTLYVTPVIGQDGFIKMSFKPEISSVEDTLETSEGNEIPIVSTSNVETSVLVKDGTTIMLAGLTKETLETSVNKLPILGDLPFVGWFFRNTTEDKQKKEVIIFLTPRIIGGDEGVFAIKDQPDGMAKPRKPKK